MHEISIAGAILDSALRHAAGRQVTRVHARIGHLRQVVPDALSLAWEMSTLGTRAEGAVLGIESVPAAVRCRGCEGETEQRSFPLACRACGGLDIEVVRGEELEIEWLEVEDADDAPEAGHGAAATDRGAVR